MTRPKKKITAQMQSFADELKNLHNSDEFHRLFDILCEYEADGGRSDDEYGSLIQRHIEKQFFKELEDPTAKTEVQFILECLSKVIRSQKYSFESPQMRDDLVQSAVAKIIGNAKYDLVGPVGKKFMFIKKVLENLYLDHCRARSSERRGTEKFLQLQIASGAAASPNKKKTA